MNNQRGFPRGRNDGQHRGRGRHQNSQNRVRAGTGRVGRRESESSSNWRRRDDEDESQQRSHPYDHAQAETRRPPTTQRRDLFLITKTKLNELLRCPPRDLIMELELNRGWGCLLEQKNYADLDEIVVAIKVFEKCLKSPNPNVTLAFLRKYFEKFHGYILGTVAFLLNELSERLAILIRDALQLYQNACAMMPRGVFQVAQVFLTIVKPHVGSLQRKLQSGQGNLLDIIESLEVQVETARNAEVESRRKTPAARRVIENHPGHESPPNDYREVEIFPSMEDMEDLKPYVRENIIAGPYDNGYHYVDIQFRLLREDFVAPLREGVQNYLSLEPHRRKKELRGNSVRYYFNVSCRGRLAALTDSVFLFALQLAPRDYQSVNWERSKRFVNGTVIGLSRDDFASMIFAFVTQRNIAMLKTGGLSVECCRPEDEEYLEAGKNYSVIESTALFEAYRYNLKVLQDIDPLLVPMEKYIVKLEKTVVPPQFITKGMCINLSPIMRDSRNTNTEVLNSLNWPRLKDTKLDDAQYAAVQSAFARELCLIHGPPGTGKTFVGLLIVETFLLNRITTKPILVVCYTNHALDQFLGGIRSFSSRIVRVGGMCKDEEMVQYSLPELRLKRRESVVAQRELAARTARQYRYRINQLRKEINNLQGISNKAYGKLIPDFELESLSGGIFRNKRDVMDWLRIERLATAHTEKAAQESKPNKAAKKGEPSPEERDKLQEMAEEIQSDEEDMLVDEKDTDELTLDVVEGLLSFHGSKATTSLDLFIESELTMSERPRLTDEAAQMLQNKLNKQRLRDFTDEECWDLYRHWHNLYMRELDKKTDLHREEYSEAMRALKELEAETDLLILQGAEVIGMTTTGAAKYKHLYEKLDIDVVIVEEAAELLEAHIVTSLSASTKQVILIGDHQQLRPATSSYKLARDFHLDVSLFERFVKNGIPFIRLKLQHRMRPEFVRLLVPHIYPSLDCEKSVYDYPHVRGMSQDLQLMNHSQLETHDGENRSKTNRFECDMVVGLVRYLVVHGYTYDKITVLAMYSGQQFLIKQKMRELNYDVRVTSVDNYQGEENDILVISFVRSNEDCNIGFLRTINRICVAFSRARHGLFCVGNFEMIAQRSPVFKNILASVGDSVWDHFKLLCQTHKNETRIHAPSDFFKVAEGGCDRPCEDRLDCGHTCPKQCHIYSNEDLKFKCIKPCLRKLPQCGHECKKLCGEDCGMCKVVIRTAIPACGHAVERFCGSEELACQKLCEKRLRCGHMCDKKCSQTCQDSCRRKVMVDSKCGHRVEVECHLRDNTDEVPEHCKQPCGSLLKCDHVCQGSCGSCYQGRFHSLCQSQCGKKLICGHVCKQPCSRVCPPCMQKCENSCVHSHCDRTCGEPCVKCVEPCARKCSHQKCTRLCSEQCSTEPCTEPCPKKLKCGHDCIGYCTDKCPTKCRLCDDEVCDVLFGFEEEDSRYVALDCGHIIESSAMQQWVDQCLESKEISMGGISCPSCTAAVLKTNRYLHHINMKRNLIEVVKSKVFGTGEGNQLEHDDLQRQLRLVLAGLGVSESFVKPILSDLQHIVTSFKRPDQTTLSKWSNILTVTESIRRIERQLVSRQLIPGFETLLRHFRGALRRTLDERVGEQQFDDILDEITRFASIGILLEALRKWPEDDDLKTCMDVVESLERYTEEKRRRVKEIVTAVTKKRDGRAVLNITDDERKMILKAVGLSQGHWYQCPNGHVYCIADCGGAMEVAKCNECHAVIGGTSHRLRGDNRVATDMDGARHSAWSEAYNPRNFNYDNLD